MVIARFRKGTDRAGTAVLYEHGAFRIEGEGILTFPQLADLEASGELEWTDERLRDWALDVPETASPELAAPAAAPRGAGLSGEQKRIIAYAVVGVVAVALLLVYGTRSPKEPATGGVPVVRSWTTLAEAKGASTLTSAGFTLTSGETKVAWSASRSEGAGDARITVCLVPAGTPAGAEQRFAVGNGTLAGAAVSDQMTRTSIVTRTAGDYSVQVFSAGCSWDVVVSQKR